MVPTAVFKEIFRKSIFCVLTKPASHAILEKDKNINVNVTG